VQQHHSKTILSKRTCWFVYLKNAYEAVVGAANGLLGAADAADDGGAGNYFIMGVV
jgi:hypothetical protein